MAAANTKPIPTSKQIEEGDTSHVEARRTDAEKTMDLAQDALLATEDEHFMTFWQAIKRYRKACFWSAMVSLTIIMDGYDTALLGSLQAFPAFQYKFEQEVGHTDKYQIRAAWQVAIGLSNPVGNFFGIFFNSISTERFGHKKTLLATLIYLVGMIFISFFAKSIEMLFVCPVILRSYLETFVVLCWGIGQFVSFGVLASYSSAPRTSYWSWRIPVAIQWLWPVVIFPIILFAPESPWWLVRKDRIDEAEKALRKLTNDDEVQVKRSIALMVHTNNLEKAIGEGTSILDSFKGTNLRRTEIACVMWSMQQWGGFVITGYATYFYEQAGLAPTEAFHMSVGQAGLHFLCTLAAFFVTGRYGRRLLTLGGLTGMSVSMFIIGFVSLAPANGARGYSQSAVYLIWYTFYELAVGPVGYIVIGEVSITRLRSHTIGLARNTYNLVAILNNVVGPYILNPTEGNWKGKCGFLTGCLIIFCLIWTYFRLPETSHRTYEELDILFDQRLPARKFKDHQVNIISGEAKLVDLD
ncbi:hypothetical protein DL95DRAFT_492219 [Leptodontidium sp. 2 PMI_412]|nr:hypothetical protein DL95DRAFT_492219 [Leptodontidium sp. 2 PMI_412]